MPIIAPFRFLDTLRIALGLEQFEEITRIEIDAAADDVPRIRLEMLATTEMDRRLREAGEVIRRLAEVEVSERNGPRRILLQDEDEQVGPHPPPPDDRMDV